LTAELAAAERDDAGEDQAHPDGEDPDDSVDGLLVGEQGAADDTEHCADGDEDGGEAEHEQGGAGQHPPAPGGAGDDVGGGHAGRVGEVAGQQRHHARGEEGDHPGQQRHREGEGHRPAHRLGHPARQIHDQPVPITGRPQRR
jgi:hypothetical protein